MSLYYQDDHVTLYHGDCLTEHREWLDADVLVTDPPYGRAWRQGEVKAAGAVKGQARNAASQAGIANDDTTQVRDEALAAWGVERRAVVFGDLMLAPPPETKLVAIYAKPVDAGLRGAMDGIRRDAEAIYHLGKMKSGIGGRSSIYRTQSSLVGSPHGIVARAGGHPHAKPLDVLETLIESLPGRIVADPFSGSGSTLVAARNMGRKAIGVELEERYCEMIAKRLDQGVLDIGALA